MSSRNDDPPSAGELAARNRSTFDDREVVGFYARAEALQPAERAVLRDSASAFDGKEVLDIGVGGGRTTVHVAPRAGRYVGVDYAPAMVAAAQRRFPRLELVVADARSLPFADAAFDTALFSYNGIDYVDFEGRARILREIARVLRPGGTFVYSTHNLLRTDLGVHDGGVGWWRPRRLLRRFRTIRRNPDWASWPTRDVAFVNDGAFGDRLLTYHARPSAELRALADHGFHAPRVYSGDDGAEVALGEVDTKLVFPWFYVSCSRSSEAVVAR